MKARYQWAQALDLKAAPENAKKIRVKLENGLPEGKKQQGQVVAQVVHAGKKFSDIVKASVTKNAKPIKKPIVESAVVVGQDKVHTVRSGETLWTIAQKYYGRKNGAKYKSIQKLNKNIIGSKGLKPGMKIYNSRQYLSFGLNVLI